MIRTTAVADATDMPTAHAIRSARKLFDGEHAAVVHLDLAPGDALKLHITPVDVCFYVLEGRGVVRIGDEERKVAAETLVESPAGIPHAWRNDSDAGLRVLVIKTPRPTRPSQILDD